MQQTKQRNANVIVRPSTYSTILVHAEPHLASSHRIEVAARLARELDAHLIGLGAETFDPSLFSGPFTDVNAGEWVNLVQEQLAHNLVDAEAAFRRDAAGADISWRTIQDYPNLALISSACAADLIVMSPRSGRNALQTAEPAEVVMAAGRPVLIVPERRSHLVGMSVVVAWKNTRECRRAITDALPFLRRAEDVLVVAVTDRKLTETAVGQTDDVVANLQRRGVEARAVVSFVDHQAPEHELHRLAACNGADLIVAGAYGHSRMREWAFGGVTNSLLHQTENFVLLSH